MNVTIEKFIIFKSLIILLSDYYLLWIYYKPTGKY